MKTQTIMLRGQDFTFTAAAEKELLLYLKRLGRATVVQKTAYLECTEALRDVLHDRAGSKTVTKQIITQAITIVGVPPVTSENIFASIKLAIHDVRVWVANARVGWRRVGRVMSATVAFVAAFAGLFVGATAALLVIVAARAETGLYQEFSYGIIRVPLLGSFPPTRFVLLIAALLFVSGACLALHAYWLLRRKYSRWPWAGVLIGCILVVSTGMAYVNHNEPIANTQVNRSYLQECGSEIPIYLPEYEPFLIYHQLIKEGYRLAATIPTDPGTMQMDTTVLCKQYRTLREKTSSDPVLQLFRTTAGGSVLPYDEFEAAAGDWSFGLFTRQ